jgi:hypothetical protein
MLRYARSSSNTSETYPVAIVEKQGARLGRLDYFCLARHPKSAVSSALRFRYLITDV